MRDHNYPFLLTSLLCFIGLWDQIDKYLNRTKQILISSLSISFDIICNDLLPIMLFSLHVTSSYDFKMHLYD